MSNEQTDPSAELAGLLRPAVLRLGRRLRQVQAGSHTLTASQLSALGVLLNHGGQPIGELAAAEQVRPPSMTRVVDGLEQRGLVVRTPNPDDRRQCRVEITEEGRSILLANRRRRDEWLTVRVAELDEVERDVLRKAAAILARVSHA